MPTYRLHYFPESGNSYKLALMLTLCGQPFEPVWTDFGAGITRTPEWRAAVNEMGEIPVLEEDGVRLTQTAPILLRLAERYGSESRIQNPERIPARPPRRETAARRSRSTAATTILRRLPPGSAVARGGAKTSGEQGHGVL